MAIHSVDMTKALNNKDYACQVIKQCNPEQYNDLVARWGNENVSKWESVDTTQYEISDEQVSAVKAEGDKKVDEATDGFDGKSDGTKSAVGTAAAGVATAGAATAAAGTVAAVKGLIAVEAGKAPKGFASGWFAAAIGVALLAVSLALKALNPNKEQAQACDDLAPVMQKSQEELGDLSDDLSDKTNELVKSTDEQMKAAEQGNKDTEAKQEEYEKFKARYDSLVAKQQAAQSGGIPLTESEKMEMNMLANKLPVMFDELTSIKAEGDDKLAEARENADAAQEDYDTTAEKMVETKEITDFSAGFDKATVDNSKMVKTAANIGKIASGVTAAAGAVHLWKWFSGEAVAGAAAIVSGGAAAIVFNGVSKDQDDYMARANTGVENRKATEQYNIATNELYEEDLKAYAGSQEYLAETEYVETTSTETTIVAVNDTPQQDNNDSNKIEQSVNSTNAKSDLNPFSPKVDIATSSNNPVKTSEQQDKKEDI